MPLRESRIELRESRASPAHRAGGAGSICSANPTQPRSLASRNRRIRPANPAPGTRLDPRPFVIETREEDAPLVGEVGNGEDTFRSGGSRPILDLSLDDKIFALIKNGGARLEVEKCRNC